MRKPSVIQNSGYVYIKNYYFMQKNLHIIKQNKKRKSQS